MTAIWPHQRKPERIIPWNLGRPLTHEERYEDELARLRWDHQYYERSKEVQQEFDERFPETFAASERRRILSGVEEPNYANTEAWLAWWQQCEAEATVERAEREREYRRFPHSPPPSPSPVASNSLPVPASIQIGGQDPHRLTDDVLQQRQKQRQQSKSIEKTVKEGQRSREETAEERLNKIIPYWCIHTQRYPSDTADPEQTQHYSQATRYSKELEWAEAVAYPRSAETITDVGAAVEKRRNVRYAVDSSARHSKVPVTPPMPPISAGKPRASRRLSTQPKARTTRSRPSELVALDYDGHTLVKQVGVMLSKQTRSATRRSSASTLLKKVSGHSKISKTKHN